MEKILYCIHIDWGWIKQRPHFIAENLNRDYQVDVLGKRVWNDRKNHNSTNLRLLYPFRLPLERYKMINRINSFIRHLYIRSIIKGYDYLWITAPTEDSNYMLSVIDKKVKVVYDCMDDILEFPENYDIKEKVFGYEKDLYERANLIICSSLYLKNKLIGRLGPKRIVVVNNALSIGNTVFEEDNLPSLIKEFVNCERKKIVYIGTISEWFDFDLCKKIKESFPNADIFLWGPCKSELRNSYQCEGLHFCGAVDHKFVNVIMNHSDILIMPFVINELILSVNPVKLYEYVRSGKPCVASRYGESESFNDFVYLYDSYKECIDTIGYILSGEIAAKKTEDECLKFAEQNTWEKRALQIKEELDKIDET